MGDGSTIAALYAQTGYTARAVHEAATAPQAAVAMAQAMTEELLKQEQKQVPKASKGDEARVADNKQEREQGQGFGSRRRSRRPSQPEPDDADRPPESPLVGNLLNVKV